MSGSIRVKPDQRPFLRNGEEGRRSLIVLVPSLVRALQTAADAQLPLLTRVARDIHGRGSKSYSARTSQI